MKLSKILVLPLFSLSLLAAVPGIAQANSALQACAGIQDPIQRFYCEGSILSGEVSQALVNSYTPRQRQLARGISEVVYIFYQQTGQPLPVTQETLQIMMQGIGASADEAPFVLDRMVANSNAIAAMLQADNSINRGQEFLNCLNTQGTGCIF
ncbi:hypothetical protein [Leptothoe sp. PORK10 BA2]|uniref:hypothetical protein n=1 Tax=Leptothoe sp. PORK10 BA2 TaxID=3110254 RepID=UPI002B1FEA2D|nr:hypothetical protein [Leptothoe sp. PORK10 BA2]MEA5464070.1 hypothetical protein [Leptothoe sp. PORK10 BA2]